MKDAAAEANCGGGARGGARGRACNPLPGGPGIMSAGITTGMRGASLEVGRSVGGVTPAPWTVCPRNLARVAPRDHTPLGKSRGGTPEGELPPPIPSPASGGGSGWGQRRTPRCGGRPCVFRRSISFMILAKREKRRQTTRPATPRGSFSSCFALHVTEIGCPAGQGACGNEKACIHLSPRAGRGRVSVANEGEGASPQF